MKAPISKFVLTLLTSIALANIYPAYAASGKNGKELYRAVLYQDIAQIKSLIAGGADVNYKENGRPIIGWAAQNGNAEVVSLLLKGGADPNIADEGVGHTALMRATETHQFETIDVILKAKADPNIKAHDGSTALTMAIEGKLVKVVQALIAAGAKTEGDFGEIDPPALLAAQSGSPENIEMIKALAKSGADMNVSNDYYTPLSYAVEQSNKDLVEVLLGVGANPNIKSKGDNYPLELALDKPAILAALLKAKADPNIKFSDDTTPLVRAVFSNNAEAVQALVAAGVDQTIADPYGSTPREIAERNNNSEILALLKLPVESNINADASSGSDSAAAGCTVGDASRMHMLLHSELEERVNAGKMKSDIFGTFSNDTKNWSQLLTNDPSSACKLLESLAAKYGVHVDWS